MAKALTANHKARSAQAQEEPSSRVRVASNDSTVHASWGLLVPTLTEPRLDLPAEPLLPAPGLQALQFFLGVRRRYVGLVVAPEF